MSHVKGRHDSERGVPLQSVEHHWIAVFRKYDHDNDGRISLQELYREVNSPDFDHDIPEQAIHNIFKEYDVNADGYITFDEFLHLLQSDVGRHLLRHALNKYIHNTIVPRRLKKVRAHADITDGEYEDEYTCMPPPICMLFVTAAEIAAFLYDFSFSSSPNSETAGIGPAGHLFYYRPDKREQFWRFLTYMFVHANVSHLVVNIVVQLMLGIPLEMVHRWWRVLIIYLAGVVAGSLGTSVSDPEVALVGASGGVYALIAAHLSTIILNWSEMEYAGWQLAVFLTLTVVDCGQAIYARYFSDLDLKIGYVAHLTGALAGLLVGLYVLRNLQVHSWEEKVKWIGFSLYVILIALAIFYNFHYS